MPNQLSSTKRRQSLAEHAAVLRALAAIADQERKTMMDVLREAAREAVRKRAAQPEYAEKLRAVVRESAPRFPLRLRTRAQLGRFKRAQREFDEVLIELGLVEPSEIQARNSVASRDRIRLIDFDTAHVDSV